MNRLTLTSLWRNLVRFMLAYCIEAMQHGRHARGNCASGLIVIAFLLSAISSISSASAQEIDPEAQSGRKIFIQRGFPGESTTVQAGTTLSGIFVDRTTPVEFDNPDRRDSAYSLWTIEPASAARILAPAIGAPLNREIEIEFLETGTATLTAYGFDHEDAGHESNEPGFNTVTFTFTIVSSLEGEQVAVDRESVPVDTTSAALTPLTDNARSALTTVNLACAATNNVPAVSAEQSALADTCELIELQDDPAASLDRLVPEEFFAIGDALTITADNQISNVRARINNVRTSQLNGFDVSSLNLQLWDQTISGTVLNTGKNALRQWGGGNASQDAIGNSALGLFANGNIAVGSIDGNGIQRDADISTNSLTIGADYRIDTHRVVGAAVGLVSDSTDFKGDNGDLDMQGVSLSAFATWYEHDKGHADLVVDVSTNSFDLSRRINLANQPDEFANSAIDATRLSLSVNVGRTFTRGATEFGPVGRITLTRAAIDGFSETSSRGVSGAGTTLEVDPHRQTSSRFSLGGEIKHIIGTPKAVFVPSLRMELQNESETDKGAIVASFQQDPDKNKMQIEGTERDSSALLVSLGTTVVFANAQSAFLFFETRAQDSHVSQNRLRVGYRAQF